MEFILCQNRININIKNACFAHKEQIKSHPSTLEGVEQQKCNTERLLSKYIVFDVNIDNERTETQCQ